MPSSSRNAPVTSFPPPTALLAGLPNMSDDHASSHDGPSNTRLNFTRCDNTRGNNHTDSPETTSNTVPHEKVTVSNDSTGNIRVTPTNPRDGPSSDGPNSGVATSDFPPLPTRPNNLLMGEVRRLKEALESERGKVTMLEKELALLAAARRWLSQAPAEVAALISSNATENENAASAAAVAAGAVGDHGGDAVGMASVGGADGNHEGFRERTGNPRSSFFSNTRIGPFYHCHADQDRDSGDAVNGRD
ncbi:uncharacterized protein BKCO1_2300036 [Diplodia corticola]|uniref:Uncharacterized protein n=1 Tax=Diplodia corticola TaxID=236234 RepID=A0A1J9R191_9PEZI|nr:uncharacterized protein BKCO1_2300036 [Diplodia corticola]OJD34361.1 hypothetical protein BKCO1_2300036 [Diplodia corticola]